MASLFNKDSGKGPPPGPYSRERIEKEIEHLNRRGTVRYTDPKKGNSWLAWPILLILIALLGLFFMDPVLHGFYREEGIRDYLYLHHFGSDQKARQLLATGIFIPTEIEMLNLRQGSFQNYYSDPQSASRAADAIIGYTKGVSALHAGSYDRLDTIGKIRYNLYVRFGIQPPVKWHLLDPRITE